MIEFKIDKERLASFQEMCKITGEEPSSKLRLMISEELDLFWEKYNRRESRLRDGWVEIGVTHVIPPAY